MSMHEAEFQIGDRVIHNLSGLEAEVTGFTNSNKVIIKLEASGRSMTVGEEDLSPVDASHEEDEYEDEYEDDDDHADQEEFYVAMYDERGERSWIGLVTKRNGTKWHEKPFKGQPDYRWGSSYMSYLEPEQVMQWIRKDYSRGYDIAGPFNTAEEAQEFVTNHFGGEMTMNESGWLKQGIGKKPEAKPVDRGAMVEAQLGWLKEGLSLGSGITEARDYFFGTGSEARFKKAAEAKFGKITSRKSTSIKGRTEFLNADGKQIGHSEKDGEGAITFNLYNKPLIKEGVGAAVKKTIKSIKRGMAGWDKNAVGVAGEKTAEPKEIVKRNKAYDDETVLRLAKKIDFGFPFGKDAEIGAKTPRGLQRKVLDREIKKRGLDVKEETEADDITKAKKLLLVARGMSILDVYDDGEDVIIDVYADFPEHFATIAELKKNLKPEFKRVTRVRGEVDPSTQMQYTFTRANYVGESKDFGDFEEWKKAVLLSYPAQAKKIKFKGRLEGKKHTVSAEIPGEDRSYGVWDMDTENGVVLSEGSSPFKPNAKVKSVTIEEGWLKAAFAKKHP